MTKPYIFNEEWFLQKKEILEKILSPLKGKPAISYLEIGIWEGLSLFWMLENILTAESSMAFVVDPYEKFVPTFTKQKETFLNNLSLSGLSRKVKFYNDFFETVIYELDENLFEIIHLDGDLRSKSLMNNLESAKRLLHRNGFLIINGYLWKPNESEKTPKSVIDEWLSKNPDMKVVFQEYYIILKFKT